MKRNKSKGKDFGIVFGSGIGLIFTLNIDLPEYGLILGVLIGSIYDIYSLNNK